MSHETTMRSFCHLLPPTRELAMAESLVHLALSILQAQFSTLDSGYP